MRPLAAKLLLWLHSSAKSGGVFIQHVLSGYGSTLLVSRFHFRLSCFHVACWEPRGRLTAAKRFLLFCTTPRISREADCELLFVAVGQFRDVAPFTGPSVPGPLFDRSLIAMVGASVGSSWCACAPMSLPCFFLWLEFGVAAGPGPRSLDHSGRGALCPAALLPAKP